ncbi:MAG: AAA family ATPase [Gammaproteobacteria bacterium]|nr:AAA family ATPase [Gammaproteobacteria bacterium]
MDYGKGDKQASLRQRALSEWLLDFMRAGVDCVAVTDHNTGESLDLLRKELDALESSNHPDFRPLHLFPGVELSVNIGCHLLAIFDTDATASDIDSLLGAVDYGGTKGDSDGVTRESPVKVVETVLERGGIPIFAHADGPKGLLRTQGNGSKKMALDASTVNQVLDCEGILAMEVVDPQFQKPELYVQRKLAWAEVLGSDSHHPDGESDEHYPGSHYTWVKMATPSLEGLRLALLDGGGFSIRRSDAPEAFDPFTLPAHRIESIEIGEARYMGRGPTPAKLDFNPWLNALIGGRGTGKSTVLHALRIAARRDADFEALPTYSESKETFNRFNQVPSDHTRGGGLTDATNIRWTLTRDGVKHRVNWAKNGGATPVEDESTSGQWQPSSVQDVTAGRFPLQLFSQGQIAELAGDDPTALLREIDRAAGVGELQGKLDGAVAAFDSSRAKIRELQGKLSGLEGPTTIALQDMERKLSRFEASGHTVVLTAYRGRQRQRQEMDRQFEAVEEAAQQIEAAAEGLSMDDLPDGLFDESSQEDREVVELAGALKGAVETARQQSREVAQTLRGVATSRRETLNNSRWVALAQEAATAYGELVKSLEEAGVTDPTEYASLVQEKQRLETVMKDIQWYKDERDKLVEESQRRLQEAGEARRAMTAARREFLTNALSQNDFVRIEVQPYGDDLQIIERSFRQALNVLNDRFADDILTGGSQSPPKGIVADLLKGLPHDPDARIAEVDNRLAKLKQRLESACAGQGDFGGFLNNYLEREYGRRPVLLDNLLTWFPEDGLAVRYSRTGDGKDFQPISQASAGQRSAAMLAFLLAHGEEPLVLDQPEDDLDNHLIYDLVVRQIRENKFRRQIIVVTHNPNIVVNGDAEMVHALDFDGGQCVVKQSGSLQEAAIRDEVCRVMEGGREAFKNRYRRLG